MGELYKLLIDGTLFWSVRMLFGLFMHFFGPTLLFIDTLPIYICFSFFYVIISLNIVLML